MTTPPARRCTIWGSEQYPPVDGCGHRGRPSRRRLAPLAPSRPPHGEPLPLHVPPTKRGQCHVARYRRRETLASCAVGRRTRRKACANSGVFVSLGFSAPFKKPSRPSASVYMSSFVTFLSTDIGSSFCYLSGTDCDVPQLSGDETSSPTNDFPFVDHTPAGMLGSVRRSWLDLATSRQPGSRNRRVERPPMRCAGTARRAERLRADSDPPREAIEQSEAALASVKTSRLAS